MLESNILLIAFAILMAFGCYLIFLWAARSGQFEDCEEIKYQIMDEER